MGADDYVRKVLVQALGEDKAGSLIDRILLGRNTTGMDTLKWMDPRAIADLIRNEHPQIIAIVLAHLDSDQAAECWACCPSARARTCCCASPPWTASAQRPERAQRDHGAAVRGNQNLTSSNIGGVKVAANILNFMDSGRDQAILAGIGQIDADLGGKIQDLMFVFDNLNDLSDRELQTLLREVPSDKLGLALRGADIKVRDRSPATCPSAPPRS
jgi:flagellar motor switch protein FliG